MPHSRASCRDRRDHGRCRRRRNSHPPRPTDRGAGAGARSRAWSSGVRSRSPPAARWPCTRARSSCSTIWAWPTRRWREAAGSTAATCRHGHDHAAATVLSTAAEPAAATTATTTAPTAVAQILVDRLTRIGPSSAFAEQGRGQRPRLRSLRRLRLLARRSNEQVGERVRRKWRLRRCLRHRQLSTTVSDPSVLPRPSRVARPRRTRLGCRRTDKRQTHPPLRSVAARVSSAKPPDAAVGLNRSVPTFHQVSHKLIDDGYGRGTQERTPPGPADLPRSGPSKVDLIKPNDRIGLVGQLGRFFSRVPSANYGAV